MRNNTIHFENHETEKNGGFVDTQNVEKYTEPGCHVDANLFSEPQNTVSYKKTGVVLKNEGIEALVHDEIILQTAVAEICDTGENNHVTLVFYSIVVANILT